MSHSIFDNIKKNNPHSYGSKPPLWNENSNNLNKTNEQTNGIKCYNVDQLIKLIFSLKPGQQV